MRFLLPLLVCFAFSARAAEPFSNPAIGTTDETGRLIIHAFRTVEADSFSYAHLSSDFGVLMFHHQGWVRFTLAEKAKNSVREFTNYEEFLGALGKLPKGSVITIYDKCLMPLFYDFYPMHQELYQKFTRDCRMRGLKVAEDQKIICTCTDKVPPK